MEGRSEGRIGSADFLAKIGVGDCEREERHGEDDED